MTGWIDRTLRIDLLFTGDLFRFPDHEDIYAVCDYTEWDKNPIDVIAINNKFQLIKVRPWRSIVPIKHTALNARLAKSNPWIAGLDEMKGSKDAEKPTVPTQENGAFCSAGALEEPGCPPF